MVARRYDNLDPGHRPHSLGEVFRWAVGDRLLGRRRRSRPGPPADRISPDLELIASRSEGVKLTWIGHASFLGMLDGIAFLVDPVFPDRIAGVYRRHVAAGLQADQLPALEAVLVTHSHYDHLDARSLRSLPRDVPVVVPMGLGAWFRRRRHQHVTELHWWDQADVGRLRVTLVPARHWSKRGILDLNASLWGGFVIESDSAAVYHAGDTAWFDGFVEIGRRFPGLDAAMLPIGGYEPTWFMEQNHLNPEQAGDAFLALGARRFVPMHWGTFRLTDEPLRQPANRMRSWWAQQQPGPDKQLHLLAVGQTVVLDREMPRGNCAPRR